MSQAPMTEDEAKRRFVEETDALNIQTQLHGLAPDSAARMRAIIADHEAKCAALSGIERATPRRRAKAIRHRLGS